MRLRAVLPNLLTALRLVLTPLVAWTILEEWYAAAIGLFALAGASDGLDGIAARKLGGETRLGARLDPIADKVFVSAIYICLAWKSLVPWWLVILVFVRDAAILLAAGVLIHSKGPRDFRPSVWGKAATCTHVATILAVLVNQAWTAFWTGPMVTALIGLAGLATIWSGAHYAWRLKKELPSSL